MGSIVSKLFGFLDFFIFTRSLSRRTIGVVANAILYTRMVFTKQGGLLFLLQRVSTFAHVSPNKIFFDTAQKNGMGLWRPSSPTVYNISLFTHPSTQSKPSAVG